MGLWSTTTQNVIGTEVSETRTISTSRSDSTLKTEIIPFVRPITITFTAEKMRPYGPVDVYFDGVNVNTFVTPSGGSLGQQPVADANGNVAGTFRIPATTFRTGQTPLILSDDVTPSDATSFGSATFASGGVLETKQATVVNTTNVVRRSTTLLEEVTTQQFAGGGDGGGDGGDPLAQTFFVNTKTNSPGCFISKITVFMKKKDPKEPLQLELRTTENGYPGTAVIRSKTVPSASVAISADSSLGTDFEFDSPAFVQNGKEYSFVLKTNSTQYEAWVGTMGDSRIDKRESITKQPNAGVMFTSSNNSAWTAVQDSDVKFKIHVAKFSTSPSSVTAVTEYPSSRTAFSTSVATTVATKNVRIFALGHGFVVGSNVEILASLPVGTPNISGIALSDLNGVRSVVAKDSKSFTVACGGSTNASASDVVALASIRYTPNVLADSIIPSVDETIFPKTSTNYSVKSVSGQSVDGTQTAFVVDPAYTPVINKTTNGFSQPKFFTSFRETAARYAGLNQGKFKIDLQTEDPYVSPVINLFNSGIVAVTNYLNAPSVGNLGSDYVAETSTKTGSALNRYVTKPVSLSVPATALKIQFAGNCVVGNAIQVFYRIVSTAETANIKEKDWIEIPNASFKYAPSKDVFYDYDYSLSGLVEYNTLQIKIVLTGTESTNPPKIRDFRFLALAI